MALDGSVREAEISPLVPHCPHLIPWRNLRTRLLTTQTIYTALVGFRVKHIVMVRKGRPNTGCRKHFTETSCQYLRPLFVFMKEAETQSSVYQYRYSHHRPRARGYEVFRWMVCYNKLLINTKCTFLSKMITNWTLNLLAHNFLQSSYNQDLSQHLNCIGLQLCFVGDYLYLIWTHWLLIRIPVWFHNVHCLMQIAELCNV